MEKLLKNKVNKNIIKLNIFKVISIITIAVTIAYSISISTYANTERAKVKQYGEAPILLKYGKVRIGTTIAKVDIGGEKYPAYCLNVEKHGVGSHGYTEYELQMGKLINNQKVYSVLMNGYPNKTKEELGLKTEEEAFTATKQAVYTELYGRNIDQYSPVDTEEGRRTYNAYKNIVENARKNNYIYKEGIIEVKEVSQWEEKSRILEKSIQILSNKSGKVTVSIEGDKIDGLQIIDENNVNIINKKIEIGKSKNIKINVPMEQLNKNKKIKIKAEAELNTYPILFGETKIEGTQNYAVAGIKVRGKVNSETEIPLNENTTKIRIVKIDKETKEKLADVKFKIIDIKDKIEKEYITNKDGEVEIKNVLPGKYIIKEVKAKQGYLIADNEQTIELKYGETKQLIIENGKIKITPKRILPKTGY